MRNKNMIIRELTSLIDELRTYDSNEDICVSNIRAINELLTEAGYGNNTLDSVGRVKKIIEDSEKRRSMIVHIIDELELSGNWVKGSPNDIVEIIRNIVKKLHSYENVDNQTYLENERLFHRAEYYEEKSKEFIEIRELLTSKGYAITPSVLERIRSIIDQRENMMKMLSLSPILPEEIRKYGIKHPGQDNPDIDEEVVLYLKNGNKAFGIMSAISHNFIGKNFEVYKRESVEFWRYV